jgi:hypothetical protein
MKPHQKHSIRTLSLLLGVTRMTLTRRLNEAGMNTAKQFTIAEAYRAMSAKFQREEDRARRQKAEADTAEITAAEKMGLLMLKSDVRLIWADAIIAARRLIQSQPRWESGKLLVALSKIKLADPRSSIQPARSERRKRARHRRWMAVRKRSVTSFDVSTHLRHG